MLPRIASHAVIVMVIGILLPPTAQGDPPAVKLTHHDALDCQPTWSPDGMQIAFTSTRSGSRDIWIISTSGEPAIQLTSDPLDEWAPAWSPDGTRIAYVRFDAIWLASPDGGTQEQLTDSGWGDSFPAWSPDSKAIAFSRMGNIWTIPSGGGTATQLTYIPEGASAPAWSPNGTEIVFELGIWDSPDLYSVDADGGGLRQLTSACPPVYDGNAAWSPDGAHLAFASDREDGNMDIWVMPAGGGPAKRLTSAAATDSDPAWSPDGRKIAFFSNRDGELDIWIMALEPEPVESATWGAMKALFR